MYIIYPGWLFSLSYIGKLSINQEKYPGNCKRGTLLQYFVRIYLQIQLILKIILLKLEGIEFDHSTLKKTPSWTERPFLEQL